MHLGLHLTIINKLKDISDDFTLTASANFLLDLTQFECEVCSSKSTVLGFLERLENFLDKTHIGIFLENFFVMHNKLSSLIHFLIFQEVSQRVVVVADRDHFLLDHVVQVLDGAVLGGAGLLVQDEFEQDHFLHSCHLDFVRSLSGRL